MKPRYRFVCALLLGTLATAAYAADAEPPKDPVPENIADLKTALAKILAETKLPGMSIALVSRDEVLWTEGFGLADVAKNIPATADTLFRIGSTSKALTALAALQLRAQGKLDFDAPLASLAPEIEFHNPWEATDPVRIVHVLEHTTGFDDVHLREYANSDPRPNNLRDALAHDPDSRVSRWPPGEQFAYCNCGPPIAAYVIEKITGQVFEDYVQQNLFDPMGMKTATYFPPSDPAVQITRTYQADGVTPYEYMYISIRPSGAINASARDMAQYVRFYLNRGTLDGRAIVSEADIQRLQTPTTTPAAKAGIKTGYALYSASSFNEDGYLFHGHSGGVPGGGSLMGYMPDAGLGYAFMFNAANIPAIMRIAKLVQGYLTRGVPKPALPAAVAIPEAAAKHYAGFYVPTNSRSELTALTLRIAGIHRLSFSDGAAQFGSLFGSTKRFVGVTDKLLRREDRPLASIALLDSPDGRVRIAADSLSLRRQPALLALGPLVLAGLAALMALSTVLFLPVWGIRALRGRIALRPHLGLRLWPLAVTAALAAFAAGPVVMFGDPEIFTRYAAITPWSLALASVSVLALVLPWLGLFGFVRGSYRGAHRGLYWHALLVLVAIGLLGLYLLAAGTIPFVTWT